MHKLSAYAYRRWKVYHNELFKNALRFENCKKVINYIRLFSGSRKPKCNPNTAPELQIFNQETMPKAQAGSKTWPFATPSSQHNWYNHNVNRFQQARTGNLNDTFGQKYFLSLLILKIFMSLHEIQV